MANTFIKADQIVTAASLLLQREIVLPRLVWRDFSNGGSRWVGSLNDTITLRVPAVLSSSTRAMRSSDPLVAQDLAETSVPVQLTDHVYQLLNITDEQLTLDITEFSRQVLAPQMRAVAEGMEDAIATALAAATWEATDLTFTEGTTDAWELLVEAREALNALNVPRSNRIFVAGSAVESALLKHEKFVKVNEAGTDSALREATLVRLAGFTIVGSNALGANDAYAMHQTAIAFGNVAPALPEGAAMKSRVSVEGLSLRYLRDYNPTNSTGPVDRSLVDAFVGAASVQEGESGYETNKRGVSIAFTPA